MAGSRSLPSKAPPTCPLLTGTPGQARPLMLIFTIWLIPVHSTSRGAGPNLSPLFWGLERGEKFSAGERLLVTGLMQMLPLESKDCRLSLPVLVPGTGCWISFKVQPGNTAKAKRTGHFSPHFFPPSLPPPFLLLSFLLFSFPSFLPCSHSNIY